MFSKDFIETTAIFTTKDYLVECGDTQAHRNLLSRAVKAGKVLRIKQGLYASNAGKYREHIHSKYSIVKAIDSKAILCYNSAFELFAGQHNIVSMTTFFSDKPLYTFAFQGREYRMYSLPQKAQKTRGYRQLDGTVVNGTTPEQTIIDALTKPDRCLGIENVLRILSTVDIINTAELFSILIEATSPVKARAGWILEQKKEPWRVTEESLVKLQGSLGQGPFYFTPDHIHVKGSYDSKWHLYFPELLATIEGWING